MSLGAGGASGRKAGPGCGRERNPAYFRRQKRCRQAFLEKRGLARDSLGTGAETEVGGTRDGEGGEGKILVCDFALALAIALALALALTYRFFCPRPLFFTFIFLMVWT